MKNLNSEKGMISQTHSCLFYLLAFVFIEILFSPDNMFGQSWQIFNSEYTYNAGSVNLERIVKTQNITDVIRDKDGTVWLACSDSYPIFIKNINSKEYITGTADPGLMKAINFRPSENSRFASLPNGEIWMITHENMLRMSPGREWEGYNTTNTNKALQSTIPVLNFDILGDLHTDREGRLWVSGVVSDSMKCGLAKFENNSWTYFMVPADITSQIKESKDASGGKGIKIISGREMVYEKNPELKLILNNLSVDANGNILMSVGTFLDKGLCKFSNGIFKLFNTENKNISTNNVFDIEANHEGVFHIATSNGLFVMDGDDKLSPFEQAYTPGEMTFDNSDQLWWSETVKQETRDNSWKSSAIPQVTPIINRYDKKNKSSFVMTDANTPLIKNVSRIYIDVNDVKYFIVTGTKSGLYILNDSISDNYPQWITYSPYKCGNEAMIHYSMTSGFNDENWNFYGISHSRGNRSLNVFKNGTWAYSDFSLSDEPTGLLSLPLEVQAVTKDKNDNFFLGTTNYIYKYDKLSKVIEGLDKSRISKSVNCMSADPEGKVWFGTTKGLANYDGSLFTYYDKKNSQLPDNFILNLIADKKNRIWVGTANGLLCIDKEKQILYDKKNGLNSERIVALAQNSAGKVFVATSNFNSVSKSIYYEENGILKEEPLPDVYTIGKMVFDNHDNLWISCENTLLCRKQNGEYIIYNAKNSPLLSAYNIDQLFVVGNEIWLIIDKSGNINTTSSSSGMQIGPVTAPAPTSKTTLILNTLKPKLSGLESGYITIVFKPDIS